MVTDNTEAHYTTADQIVAEGGAANLVKVVDGVTDVKCCYAIPMVTLIVGVQSFQSIWFGWYCYIANQYRETIGFELRGRYGSPGFAYDPVGTIRIINCVLLAIALVLFFPYWMGKKGQGRIGLVVAFAIDSVVLIADIAIVIDKYMGIFVVGEINYIKMVGGNKTRGELYLAQAVPLLVIFCFLAGSIKSLVKYAALGKALNLAN